MLFDQAGLVGKDEGFVLGLESGKVGSVLSRC